MQFLYNKHLLILLILLLLLNITLINIRSHVQSPIFLTTRPSGNFLISRSPQINVIFIQLTQRRNYYNIGEMKFRREHLFNRILYTKTPFVSYTLLSFALSKRFQRKQNFDTNRRDRKNIHKRVHNIVTVRCWVISIGAYCSDQSTIRVQHIQK